MWWQGAEMAGAGVGAVEAHIQGGNHRSIGLAVCPGFHVAGQDGEGRLRYTLYR